MHLIKGFDPKYIGAYPDLGHLALDGEDWDMGFSMIKDYISVVGIKDALYLRQPEGQMPSYIPCFVKVGEGCVNWHHSLRKLYSHDFDGPLAVHTEYKFDESIIEYMRTTHKLAIGESMAERMKKEIGSACPPDDGDGEIMHVKGRDLISGLPKEIGISQRQIAEALAEPVAQIIDTIKRALEQTPAELAADIVERGIMLTGGGSLLGNLDKVLRRSTSLPISIAEDPLLCVVMGTGKALEQKTNLSDIFASD